MDLENLRRSYDENSLEKEELAACPFEQFSAWFDDAKTRSPVDWFEANAMTLATASNSGEVSARIVLLKRVTTEGFVFFTNYDSDKAQQLSENPHASLVFYWPHVERQIRVEGRVEKAAADVSDEYFHARPQGSQLGAIASPQSRPIDSRETLVQQTMELAEKFQDAEEIPRPDYWGGYLLKPSRIEFWQGRPSRLHDRFVYTLSNGSQPSDEQSATTWSISRLAP